MPDSITAGEVELATSRCAVSCVVFLVSAVAAICGPAPSIVAMVSPILILVVSSCKVAVCTCCLALTIAGSFTQVLDSSPNSVMNSLLNEFFK